MTSLYVDRRGVTLKADGEALVFYENGERMERCRWRRCRGCSCAAT